MKKLSILIVPLIFINCATLQPPTFNTVPVSKISYEESFNILAKTIEQFYPSLITADSDSGIIYSITEITKYSFAGMDYGGKVPGQANQFVARVKSKNPLEYEMTVLQYSGKPMTNYQAWTIVGSDLEKTNIIQQTFAKNLKSHTNNKQ